MDALREHGRTAAIAAAAAIALYLAAAALLGLWPFGGELSREEFLQRGDEICAEAHDEFRDLQDTPPRTAAGAADLTGSLLEISRGELDELRDLDGPDELQGPLDRYLAAREDGIAEIEAGLRAAEEEDAQAYAEAQARVAAGQLRRLRLAQAVGFEECSRPLIGRDELAEQAEPPTGTDAPPTVQNPPTGG